MKVAYMEGLVYLAYLSPVALAMELLTSTVKFGGRSALIGVLLSSGLGDHLGRSTGLASLGLPMGRR